jgi:hypothetical protein
VLKCVEEFLNHVKIVGLRWLVCRGIKIFGLSPFSTHARRRHCPIEKTQVSACSSTTTIAAGGGWCREGVVPTHNNHRLAQCTYYSRR